jgi:hypothetical protein
VRFRRLPLDDLYIDDERAFRHVELYDALKQALRRDGYRFRVPDPEPASWDRVLFLNLTFWDPGEGGDVLASATIPADVVAHVAWHHLGRRAIGGASADAMLMGESIASAFDLYLVGRLLGHAPDAGFLETQVPAMAEVAEAAGLDEGAFEALLAEVARDPDRAFEDLRALLFEASTSLLACASADDAALALSRLEARRFAPLLHHYELSTWILYARAHARDALAPDGRVRALDAALRSAPVALDLLEKAWISAASPASPGAPTSPTAPSRRAP